MPSPLEVLEALEAEAREAFAAAADPSALEEIRIRFLGKKGKLKDAKARVGQAAAEDRPRLGAKSKDVEAAVQGFFEEAKARVEGLSTGGQAARGAPGSGVDELRQERLGKLAKYEAKMGPGSAWGARFANTTSIEALRAKFPRLEEGRQPEQNERFGTARLAARVMLRRDQSKKLIFLTVQDQSGEIQVALWNKKLDEAQLDLLRDTLDLWDLLGVEGELAYTQRGEPTVWATSVVLLSKCLAPPPEKHHGLQDKELRYRHRHLDLVSNPDSRKAFITRAKLVSGVRRFLDAQGFLEMETPVLQTIPGGAAARPFKTHLNALSIDMYLRIATEIPLKKLLVGGLEKVYELGRIFRNEGVDYTHNPEFTTVELYQACADLRDMMALVENLVSHLARELTGDTTVTFRGKPIRLGAPWPRLDYCELLLKHAGVKADDEAALDAKIREAKENPEGMSMVDKIDEVFGTYVEPHLTDACFVINQPVEMSPLCKAHPQDPKKADRFEAFAASMEIANAYSELNDPLEQRKRLAAQMRETWAKFMREVMDEPKTELPGELRLEVQGLVSAIESNDEWQPETGSAMETLRAVEVQTKQWKLRDYFYERMQRLEDPSLLIDEDFLHALEHGMPPAGGMGIGIDRLCMLIAGCDSIRDVVLFPLMRPEK
ncbi:MAG: lysine--tRNA ligase [Planctomycetota bacterium]|nr:lysine--tRNA ligase [Planctomycetota bacterium]